MERNQASPITAGFEDAPEASRGRRPRAQLALNRIYRGARAGAYRLLDPLDSLYRRWQGMGHYPPIRLRRHVSHLGSFDGPGYEFAAYLKLLLGLESHHRVWDVACGCGLLELALESAGWRGLLVGTDIHAPCIGWAERHISARVPNFEFIHSDIYNEDYWPAGRLSAREWFAGFDESDFDVVVAKSLFTHMFPDELDLYLEQLSKRLKPGGRGLLTFFLLNPEQRQLVRRNDIRFHPPDRGASHAVKYRFAPSVAVAYEQSELLLQLGKHGLRLLEGVRHGTWSGRRDGLSYQDIVVVGK